MKAIGTLRVIEIYRSLQGESSWAGMPCTFIRLAGCDLRCTWCDSEFTFTGGTTLSLDQVLEKVKACGGNLVEITGGEPLLQKNTPLLSKTLLDAGYTVLLETGGHHPLIDLDPRVIKIVDVKCPGSGEEKRNCAEALKACGSQDEIKFVMADRADYDWAKKKLPDIVNQVKHVLFSPVWGKLEPHILAQWILDDGISVRLNLQQHKILWGDERGR